MFVQLTTAREQRVSLIWQRFRKSLKICSKEQKRRHKHKLSLTWTSRGCSQPGLWSWCRFPPFQHRLSLMSARTCTVGTQRDELLLSFVCARVPWETENNFVVSLLDQVWIPIQFASVLQPSGPGKDARYGVGTGGFSLQREWSHQTLYQWWVPRTF